MALQFSDNGLGMPSRPSSSQKKKGKGSFLRKSITITRRKLKQGSPGSEDKVRTVLYAYRAELRPLLDAIRFVESSNRVNCPDGDGGASIGPLQISEHYHLDAWKNKRTYSWLRCRNLEHAENTVVAYWMRYCSDALTKHDWEILAKIHNGGPQGPQREKTAYYWSKVSKYLDEQLRLSSSSGLLSGVNHQKGTSFTIPDRKLECVLRKGLKISAAERQKPIVNKHRRIGRAPLTDISSTLNVRESHETTRDDLNIQHLGHEFRYLNSATEEPEESIKEVLDDVNSSPVSYNNQLDSEPDDRSQNGGSPINGIVEKARRITGDEDEDEEGAQGYWRSPESFGPGGRVEILYSTELSQQKEEEILSELAQLLPFGLSEAREEVSFEFPRAAVEVEFATPVLQRRIRIIHEPDPDESLKIKTRSISEDFDATGSGVENPEPPLTPNTESSLLSELADLFHLPQPASPTRKTQDQDEDQNEDGDEEKKNISSLSLADFLLEIPDPSASVEYVKALFSCEDMLLEKLCNEVQRLSESLDSSKPGESLSIQTEESHTGDVRSFISCSCHCSCGSRLAASLRSLCSVWEEQGVDLLTRSLRFKMLSSQGSGKREAPCIAWEINALKSIPKSEKSQRAAKQLIQKQRDTIYVNIGAYASRSERLGLYSTWGVRRLASNRLKKIVYELLWGDPKRFSESAELVTSFL